tara:strand:- start:1111 stop:2490 length:1380 start_codon:yes stop_codon:yes gene_type:complete
MELISDTTPVVRESVAVSKKEEVDSKVVNAPHYLLFEIYLTAYNMPRSYEYTFTRVIEHTDPVSKTCHRLPQLVPLDKHLKDLGLREKMEEFFALVQWRNYRRTMLCTETTIDKVLNLQNVDRIRAEVGFKGTLRNYLHHVLKLARTIWEEGKELGHLLFNHTDVRGEAGAFELHPHCKNKWTKADPPVCRKAYPMYNRVLRKLDPDDIKRVTTHGLSSSCIFLRDHTTKSVGGHKVYQFRCPAGKLHATQLVRYMQFYLTNTQANTGAMMRASKMRLHPYPDNTFPGHIHGVDCNPLHYMEGYKVERAKKTRKFPTRMLCRNDLPLKRLAKDMIQCDLRDIQQKTDDDPYVYWARVLSWSEDQSANDTDLDALLDSKKHALGSCTTRDLIKGLAIWSIGWMDRQKENEEIATAAYSEHERKVQQFKDNENLIKAAAAVVRSERAAREGSVASPLNASQ